MRSAIRITDTCLILRAEGIDCPATVYAFADTHLTLHDERDSDDMMEWLASPEPGLRDLDGDLLRSHLTRAEEAKADLILAAGDLLHFPSRLNAETAGECLDAAVMPVLATPGNHDWVFPGQDDTAELRRAHAKTLRPVYGKNPSFQTHHLAGITFLALDNASRRVTREQARESARVLAGGGPTVMMMHIPVSLPTLREPARIKLGEADLMCDADLAPARGRELGDDESTAMLVDAMSTAPNLLAVVCGHLHLGREDSLSPSCVQVVVPPGCRNGYRILQMEPW